MRMALHFIAVFREWYLFPTAAARVGNRYNADIISLSEYGVGEGMYFWVQRGDQTSDFELLMSRNNCHT